jgi:acyl-CoA thioesterase
MKAEEIARRILREDEASRWLGMQLEEVRAVAASCSIEFLQPAAMHDRLVAEAAEVARAGRSGVYDVRVTNQKGELVALFRGKSATVKGVWIE